MFPFILTSSHEKRMIKRRRGEGGGRKEEEKKKEDGGGGGRKKNISPEEQISRRDVLNRNDSERSIRKFFAVANLSPLRHGLAPLRDNEFVSINVALVCS